MIERKNHLDTRATALLLACCAFWGLQQILIKTTVTEVPPLWQASIRMGGAVVLLWLWCAWRRVPLFERDGTLPGGLLAGALFAGEFTCIYIGLQHTTASRLTVFLYTSPFVVALLLPRFVPAERLRGVQWVGLAIAFAGVVLAFSESVGRSTSGQLRGDALALAAGVMWGLTTLAIRTTRLATASAEKTLFYQIAVTAAISPLLSLMLDERWSLSYSTYAWFSIALQTVIGAFASYLAWMWMLRHYPATRISSFTFLTPLFALVFGVVLLSEPLTLQLVLALAGVALGIVLVNRRAGVKELPESLHRAN
jgi:drug/metabolite transporter (DMT)-like permease